MTLDQYQALKENWDRPRPLALPSDWKRRRIDVARRAGWRCEGTRTDGGQCREAGTDCDHRISRASPEGIALGAAVHALSNLQWLCRTCHVDKTSAEARIARAQSA